MINRTQQIKSKGFKMQLQEDTADIYSTNYRTVDFSKIKVGLKTLEDAVLSLNRYEKANARLGNRKTIEDAIANSDLPLLREISDYFFKTSGIYARLCKYIAYLYRYDWVITPYVNSDNIKDEKVVEGFHKAVTYLDNFEVKRVFSDIALKIVKNGVYYGYKIQKPNKLTIQELPANYCRSRLEVSGVPIVEFKMTYFDDNFRDEEQRRKILKMFPPEFTKGYNLLKKNKLPPLFSGDTTGWFVLDPKLAFKFNFGNSDIPPFISVIPSIIDLDDGQELDKKKMEQELLKIIIQKMPIDKNGDLVFDVDEAQELHNNAVRMLKNRSVGLDVLTTFADVEVEDMANNRAATAVDDLERLERAVFNNAGVSQMQFNTDGNIALEKSILNDEATVYPMILQFERFLNDILEPFNKNPKKVLYRVQLLCTTIYNYKEMSKLYKEQTQLGYSKMLPQIALGQSQSSVLATAHFENEILELYNVFIPPMTSNTMNAQVLQQESERRAGRPEKENDQKSEKTIQNIEAKG